jgi:alginate O-acetyltransferase complex protein AlgI
LQVAYGLLVVGCGWVLFRAGDLSQAAAFWRAMSGFGPGGGREFVPALYLDGRLLAVMMAGSLISFPLAPRLRAAGERLAAAAGRSWPRSCLRLLDTAFPVAVLLASAMQMAASTYNPFIYFQF